MAALRTLRRLHAHFRSFDWLAAWYRHVGAHAGVIPVIAVGRFANGEIALIIPLAIEPGRASRRLCWLGQDLCDYNAPLLSPDFSQRVSSDRFLAALAGVVQADPNAIRKLRYDWIELEKMPQTVGAQINPFTHLAVTPNASGAHLTQLGDDWDKFYFDKRSSATRRHDRAKRRHMSEFGEIRFVSCAGDRRRATHARISSLSKRAKLSRASRHSRYFLAAGLQGLFLDFASNTQSAASVSHQPHRDRQTPAWRRISPSCSATAIITCWPATTIRRRSTQLRSRRAASARTAGPCDQARLAAVRFYDRRRALQAGMGRSAVLKLYDYSAAATMARLAGQLLFAARAAGSNASSSRRRSPGSRRLAVRSTIGALLIRSVRRIA